MEKLGGFFVYFARFTFEFPKPVNFPWENAKFLYIVIVVCEVSLYCGSIISRWKVSGSLVDMSLVNKRGNVNKIALFARATLFRFMKALLKVRVTYRPLYARNVLFFST